MRQDFPFDDGALPRKYKLLIGMAFYASYGAVNSVKSLAQQALDAGATKEEIMEAFYGFTVRHSFHMNLTSPRSGWQVI